VGVRGEGWGAGSLREEKGDWREERGHKWLGRERCRGVVRCDGEGG